MKVFFAFILALVLLSSFATSGTAETQGPTSAPGDSLAAGILVSQVVQNLAETVSGVIASLEASMGTSLFQTRQHLQLLIDQLQVVADGSMDKFFGELDSAEQKVFRDVTLQLNALRELEQVTASHVAEITTNTSSAIVNLPFAKRYPVVFNYDPLFVRGDGTPNTDYVSIEVSGALLSSHDPYLTISDDTRCRRSRRTDTTLAFLCDKHLFTAGDTIGTVTGRLYVYERQTWLASWFKKRREYSYDISINTIPTVLGHAVISATTRSTTLSRRPRAQDFSHWNGHCSSTTHPRFAFNAGDGWRIDETSIRHTCNSSRRSLCNGIRDVTALSFSYSCTVTNTASCGPLWRDERGHCGGRVEWEEVQPHEVMEDIALGTRELFWDTETLIELPAGTVSVRIIVDKADGTRRIITTTDSRDAWLNVDVNLEDRQIIIRPVDLERAMG